MLEAQKEVENVVSAGSVSVETAPTPQTPLALQPQSSAQFDQAGFIHSLLIKAQAKIQFNKQKKLEKIVVLAQKNKIITNNDVQKILYVSDATATRYLVKLVQQGRLVRAGNPRDAKYQFVR
jgi:predicted HTH transcriptional regulator